MTHILLCEVKLKPLLKRHMDTHTHTHSKCESTIKAYNHRRGWSTLLIRENHISVKAWERGNTQSTERVMLISPTVIWSDTIMQEPRLFLRRKKMRGQKDWDLRMPPNPLGASVFFWCSRAMQRSGRVYDHDSSTPPPLLGHSSRPKVGKLPRLWHDFLNFLLNYDESKLCVFSKAWCMLESALQMALCQVTTAAPDSHRGRMQKKKWLRCLNQEPLLQPLDFKCSM